MDSKLLEINDIIDMKMKIDMKNCSYEQPYLVEVDSNSYIQIEFQIEKLVSIQSKIELQKELKNNIQKELSKFVWINSGQIFFDLCWYLSGFYKHETDKIADIDNLTKPIIDSFSGNKGIIIDDSQITNLQTSWIYKNEENKFSTLFLKITFNNEFTLDKNNLIFIEYDGAICFPINTDINNIKSLYQTNKILKMRKQMRATKKELLKLNPNYYVSAMSLIPDFHKSRLNGFSESSIIPQKKLNEIWSNVEVSFNYLLFLLKGKQ